VVANVTDRNWKGIIIAVLVISSVLALIVTSVVLLTPPDEGPRVKGRRFELEDIFSPDFQPLRLNGSWISGKPLFVFKIETVGRFGVIDTRISIYIAAVLRSSQAWIIMKPNVVNHKLLCSSCELCFNLA